MLVLKVMLIPRPPGQRALCRALLAALAMLAAVAAPAGAATAERPDPTGRLVLLLKRPDLPAPPGSAGAARGAAPARAVAIARVRSRLAAVVESFGLERRSRSLPLLGVVTVEPPVRESVASLRSRLLADPRVVAVQPEYRRQLRLVPNDPAFGAADPNAPENAPAQWHLHRENFPAAWDIAKGGGVLVGIVDSGADGSHPDLADRIAGGKDNDDNAFHSDAFDADENGHGTHVSGLACAKANNGYGVASAGFDCRIIIEKNNSQDISDTALADSITDATEKGARVINMSLGGPGESAVVARAVDFAVGRDVVLVSAAANDPVEDQGIPAKLLQPTNSAPDINAGRGLVVTAAEYDDTKADFAGFGTQISIAAYGDSSSATEGIFSTYPAATTEMDTGLQVPPSPPCFCRVSFAGDNRFAYLRGTSMATPQVTGAAALIRGLNPSMRAPEVIKVLKQNARRPGGWDAQLGWGILDAGKAVAAAQEVDRDPPSSRVLTTARVRSRTFTLRIRAKDATRPGVKSSGIVSVTVFAARDKSKTFRRVGATRGSTLRFKGLPGHKYRFYSIARDKASPPNVEAAPARPDGSTLILRSRPRR